jgi:CxxC motif-containing protein
MVNLQPSMPSGTPNTAHHPTESTRVVCVECPNGCRVEVELCGEQVINVRGNTCAKGVAFALQERIEPKRTLTTTMAIKGAFIERAPVKTQGQVPLALLADIKEFLHTITLRAPLERGQVLVADVFGTGVDVIATKGVPATDTR